MKLSLKLPLAFTVSLLLLFAAALFGISRLTQAARHLPDHRGPEF